MSITTSALRRRFFPGLLSLLLMGSSLRAAEPMAPKTGELAPGFTLPTLEGRKVSLAELTRDGPVVLVVLRGWVGKQCPLCTRQVNAFIGRAGEFERKGAQVVMVYPGPAGNLEQQAREFLQGTAWPAQYRFLLDPALAFTRAYGLRWDAPNETAYPATFVIGADGRVRFAKVSTSHGGRAGVDEVLGSW